ncbi:hypothetical protein ACA910_011125 [Epithemia clementina (nom. ined.)]
MSVTLYDRSHQKRLLQEAFLQLSQGTPNRNRLILITGPSGTGKTALASTLKQVETNSNVLYVSGKFDQLVQHVGYLPFRQAMAEYARQEIERVNVDNCYDDNNKNKSDKEEDGDEDGREGIVKLIQGDEHLLTEMIPGLASLLFSTENSRPHSPLSSDSSQTTDCTHPESGASGERTRFAFRRLMRAIATQQTCPAVLFLDDLQWADKESLVLLLEVLLDSVLMKSWLVVGACRGNEVSYHDELSQLLRELEDVHNIGIQDICVGNLDIDGICNLVAGELSLKPDSIDLVSPVAEYVYARTGGNLFATKQLICLLMEGNALTKAKDNNDESHKIIWDSVAASQLLPDPSNPGEPSISDPASIVSVRLSLVGHDIAQVLKFAACFGAIFDARLLEIVVNLDVETAATILSRAVELGFIYRLSGEQQKQEESELYKFIHDKIQQAAYQLMSSDEEVQQAHFLVGTRLWRASSDQKLEDMAVVVANQLTRCLPLITSSNDRLDFCQLCLQSANNLKKKSDFKSALRYMETGVEVLSSLPSKNGDIDGAIHWRDHYDLSLEIFIAAAELSKVVGEHEKTLLYVHVILEHAQSTLDKAKAKLIKMLSLGSQHRLGEAIAISVDILADLGERIPLKVSRSRCLYEVSMIRRLLRRRSDLDILSLPRMSNPEKVALMVTLHHTYLYAYYFRRRFAMVVCIRNIKLTLKYGLSLPSGLAFALYSVSIANIFGALEEGCRFGALALRILEKLNSDFKLSRAVTATYGMVFPSKFQIRECLPPLFDAFKSGMKEGDIECALMAMHYYTANSIWAGLSLMDVYEIGRTNLERMVVYRYQHARNLQLPYLQFMANLLGEGHTNDPTLLSGEHCNEADYLSFALKEKEESQVVQLYALKMLAAVVMSEFGKAIKYSSVIRQLGRKSVHHTIDSGSHFLEALSILARQQQRNRWKRCRRELSHAKSCFRTVQRYAALAPANERHRVLILNAEFALLRGDVDRALRMYDEASSVSANGGFLWEKALACERWSWALLRNGRIPDAFNLLRRTRLHYQEWGASAKVAQLDERFFNQSPSAV